MLIGFNLAPVVATSTGPRTSGWPSSRCSSRSSWPSPSAASSAHLDLPRPHLRHRPVLAARQDGWPDHLRPRRRHRGHRAPALEHRGHRRRPVGSACRRPPRSPPTARGRGWHMPTFSMAADPACPARRHRPHRREHRPRQGCRRDDRSRPRPGHGQAIAGDGVGTAVASFFGGSPTTTYAENIGVMAATWSTDGRLLRRRARGHPSSASSPKFGALVASVLAASSAASPSCSTA